MRKHSARVSELMTFSLEPQRQVRDDSTLSQHDVRRDEQIVDGGGTSSHMSTRPLEASSSELAECDVT